MVRLLAMSPELIARLFETLKADWWNPAYCWFCAVKGIKADTATMHEGLTFCDFCIKKYKC